MTSTSDRTRIRRQVLVSSLLAIGLTVGSTSWTAGNAMAGPVGPAVGATAPAAQPPPLTTPAAQPVTTTPAANTTTTNALAPMQSSLGALLGMLQRLVAGMAHILASLRIPAPAPSDACAADTTTTCDYGVIAWVSTRFANNVEDLATPTDVDWLRFTASFTGPWQVTSSALTPGGALAGSLMDSQGREIASGQAWADGSVGLSAVLQAGSAYYVVIRHATPGAAGELRYAVTFSSPGIRVGDIRLWIGVIRDAADLAGAADRSGYGLEGYLEQEQGPYLPDRTVQLVLAGDGRARPTVRDFTTGDPIPATGCPIPDYLRSSAWWQQPGYYGLPGVPVAPTLSCYAISTNEASHFAVTVTSETPGVVAPAGWFDPVAPGLGAQWYLALSSELSLAFPAARPAAAPGA